MKWSNSNNYSANDLIAMQKDAMERVREMQRRSDERLRQSNSAIPKPIHPPAASSAPQSPAQAAPEDQGNAPSNGQREAYAPEQSLAPSGKISQALQALGIDQDRLILFAVLLVLYNDGADYTLLLAILYLLL